MNAITKRTHKLTILSMMISIDFVLSPLFRIEGMAPMSSVVNIVGAVLMGPIYATIMAFSCGLLRMILLGIPPLALTGAVFGAFLAGCFYRHRQIIIYAIIGEILGTGIIGSLLSYPIMVLFTGSRTELFWFIYTPRFIGASIIGGLTAYLLINKLQKFQLIQQIEALFQKGDNRKNEKVSEI